MADDNLDRIAQLIKELEDMCGRAKQIREEIEAARGEGRFWRQSPDVRKTYNGRASLSEAADTKVNLN